MNRVAAALFLAGSLLAGRADAQTVRPPLTPAQQIRIDDLVGRMTLPEKLGQLSLLSTAWSRNGPGDRTDLDQAVEQGAVGGFFNAYGRVLTHSLQERALTQSRLGIPLYFGFDVIHGFRTLFPSPLALASSWEPELTRQAMRVSAEEAAAEGVSVTFAPMLDVTRDPRWGRIVEGPGEDPFLAVALAQAAVRGFQDDDLSKPGSIAAIAKHIGAYGAVEGGRDYNTVEVTDRTLREIFLPSFQAAVAAGVAGLMPTLSDLGGVPGAANRRVLRDIVRNQWRFDGVLMTDDTAVADFRQQGVAAGLADAARLALAATIDIDMQSGAYARLAGAVPEAPLGPDIDAAVRRVLALKARLGLFERPYREGDAPPSQVTEARRAASRDAARRSMVLLKNAGNLLPLPPSAGRIALIGPLGADGHDPIGSWPGAHDAPDAVTLLAALQERVPPSSLTQVNGTAIETGDTSRIPDAVAAAKQADLVILALGESREMSGEAKSRASLDLPGQQRALAEAVLATGKPVIAVLFNGHPLALPWLQEKATSILEAWFPGTESGHAVADILWGAVAPLGRLPVTVPRSVGQIPIYYNHRPTSRPPRRYDPFTSKYIDESFRPLYPFGFGLTFTDFSYGPPRVDRSAVQPGGTVEVSVDVLNTGARTGDELVQLYIRQAVASVSQPVAKLKGFTRLHLESGESGTARFRLAADDLALIGADGTLGTEPGEITVMTGPDAERLQVASFSLLP